jgi:Na+/melibiose symporter-like transporter
MAFLWGYSLEALLAFANGTRIVEKPRQAEGGKDAVLTRSVRGIRVVGAIVIRAIVVGVVGAIKIWVPKEVKAQVTKAMVVMVVMLPMETLWCAVSVLERLPLEMIRLHTWSLHLDTASGAALSPG